MPREVELNTVDEFRQRTSDHSSTEPNIKKKLKTYRLKDWSKDEKIDFFRRRKTLLLQRFKELNDVTVV